MVTIKAFKALRPQEELVTKVAALPYDVMNTEEARACVKGNPYSFLHIDKAEIHVTNPKDDEEVYRVAGDTLKQMIAEGVFVQDEPSLYIYGLTNAYTSQYGLVCCVSAKEYDAGVIKKHENTRTDKEQDRIKHVTYCNAHTGPIFLAYKDLDCVTRWMKEYVTTQTPIYDFISEDGVRHEVYQVSHQETIEDVIAAFKASEALYIADGHHRAAAAAAVARSRREMQTGSEAAEYFLATIFPKEQLYIMDYNRVLKDESGLSQEDFFAYLAKHFEVKVVNAETYQPTMRHTFGMRYNKQWYALVAKSHIINEEDPVKRLDVAILQDQVLLPIFHIEDPKNDKRIDFIGGIRGIAELNRRTDTDMDIAFSMYPTSMDELIQVADAKLLMPPKSTWFEPKLRSGIFIHLIE